VGQVLHGCRQLVPWGVPFSGVTSATPVPCWMITGDSPAFCGGEVGTTSSQHGPYVRGNTHTTMEPTMGCQVAIRS